MAAGVHACGPRLPRLASSRLCTPNDGPRPTTSLAGEFPPGVVRVRKGTVSETDYIKVIFPDLAKRSCDNVTSDGRASAKASGDTPGAGTNGEYNVQRTVQRPG